eukprot:GHVU01169950.1.p3 GENE.GHVU01169950.1~~GHVU01169950.1.p3  ORF type:complete len:131 (-),score=19.25 GHVU01169950.1:2859-3251(-)
MSQVQQDPAKSIFETLRNYWPGHELPDASTAKWQAIMERSKETRSLLSVGGIMNTKAKAIKRMSTRYLAIKEPLVVKSGEDYSLTLLHDNLKAKPTVKSNVKGQLQRLLKKFQQFIEYLSLHVETGLSKE